MAQRNACVRTNEHCYASRAFRTSTHAKDQLNMLADLHDSSRTERMKPKRCTQRERCADQADDCSSLQKRGFGRDSRWYSPHYNEQLFDQVFRRRSTHAKDQLNMLADFHDSSCFERMKSKRYTNSQREWTHTLLKYMKCSENRTVPQTTKRRRFLSVQNVNTRKRSAEHMSSAYFHHGSFEQ